ncbi:hypothetical protein L7F22_041053 [Adiantum nelumboides]|nr:hypothetical protein [Adiantum nelumboides]
MSLKEHDVYDIKKFDGPNFALWKNQMQDVLVQKKKKLPIMYLERTEQMNMTQFQWDELDKYCKCTVRLQLAKFVYVSMLECESAYMESASVASHIDDFDSLFVQIRVQYMNMDDEMKAIFLLCSLPPSWDIFCTTISNSAPSGLVARIAAIRFVLTTIEQACWDVKYVQAHALILLFVKSTITPHICSTKSAKQAWDIMAGLYAGCNEAKIALLRKDLELKMMNEKDDMDTFLAGVRDTNEQLISTGEVILNSSHVQTILDALPYSYQTFDSTWRLMSQRNLEAVKFDVLKYWSV